MCVCVRVRRPAAGPTQAIIPKFGRGSSFHPGSAPSQGAAQNVGPQGYLPHWPRLKFPEGLRVGRGPANKSCSSGWVSHVKFYFWGLTQTWGPQGPLHQMGVYVLRIRRGPENKSCSSGWNCHVKFYFWGLTPNLGPAGSIPPNGGICIENWAGASKQNLLLGVGLPCEILFSGGSPQTSGPQGPLHQMGVFALIILRGPATKSSSSGWVCTVKFYLWGAHPNPGPVGSTPPNSGICADNFAGDSEQKLLLGVGFPNKILFVGGSPQPRAWGVHSTKWGYLRWELRGGQQTKAASRGRFAW